jgi:alanyl-tRNA synthetase
LNKHVVVLVASIDGKAAVLIGLSDEVASTHNLDATKLLREQIAPLIKGGGGGQKTLATAGGQDISNLPAVVQQVRLQLGD